MLCQLCAHFFFFFQAEDGIRDYKVTGVQTCALPISRRRLRAARRRAARPHRARVGGAVHDPGLAQLLAGLPPLVRRRARGRAAAAGPVRAPGATRSEEHTSELQSPCNLVCRLLLEKKNTRAGSPSSPRPT